jgi:hypothetical protein
MKMVLPQISLTGALRHYECHIHRHAVSAGGDRAVSVAFKTPKHGKLTTMQQRFNKARNGLRAIGERGNSLLKMTFRALRNVSLDPWRIGAIVAAALAVVPGPQGTATSSPAPGTAPAPPSTTPTRKANANSHPENGAESVLTPLAHILSTCGNCRPLHDLHHLRGHLGDPAPDHRPGGHRARRQVA